MSLEDAIQGKEIKISVPRRVSCKSCNGTGAKNGTALKTCDHCNGQGQVRVSQGFFSVQQTCPVCKGRGTVIEESCPDCNGSGFIQETKKLAVKIILPTFRILIEPEIGSIVAIELSEEE